MDLFWLAYVRFALVAVLLLVPWRVLVERAHLRNPARRPGPLWSFVLGALLLPAGPSLLLVALERTDWLDYPDGGQAGAWCIAGLLSLALGTQLLAFSNTLRPK